MTDDKKLRRLDRMLRCSEVEGAERGTRITDLEAQLVRVLARLERVEDILDGQLLDEKVREELESL